MYDEHEGAPLRDLPRELAEMFVHEWRSRTLYGKLNYPFWFVGQLVFWAFMLFLVAVAKLHAEMSKPTPPAAPIYKEEEDG